MDLKQVKYNQLIHQLHQLHQIQLHQNPISYVIIEIIIYKTTMMKKMKHFYFLPLHIALSCTWISVLWL